MVSLGSSRFSISIVIRVLLLSYSLILKPSKKTLKTFRLLVIIFVVNLGEISNINLKKFEISHYTSNISNLF